MNIPDQPDMPAPSYMKNAKVAALWADDLALRALIASQGQTPPLAPPPVVTPVVEGLMLVDGVVYFEDGTTPAGYSQGVVSLLPPAQTETGNWRQVNIHGDAWDWVVSTGAAFRTGSWVAVVAPLPVVVVPTPPPPVVVPPVVPSGFLYGPHYMLSDIPQDETVAKAQLVRDIRFMKSVGQRFAFAYSDASISPQFNISEGEKYGRWMQWFLDVALLEGLAVVPQMQGNQSDGAWADLFKQTLDHPAILRRNGKAVAACWNFKPTTDASFAYARQQYGKPVETWAVFDWWEAMNPVHDDDQHWDKLDQLLQKHPQIDGLVNFAVGGKYDFADPAKIDNLIEQNSNIVRFCRAAGKTCIPGFALRYHTSWMTPEGVARVLDAIVASAPDAVTLTSANDWGESGINREPDRALHAPILSHLAPLLTQ